MRCSFVIVAGVFITGSALAGPPLHVTPTNPAPTGDPAFYEDFNNPTLDCNRWRVAQQAFRGDGNSLIRGDVEIQNGCLVLRANGDFYTGPLRGVNKDGSYRTDGKRTGGGIATEQYFGSGKYEMRVKMANVAGVASSFFTLNYQEYYPGDPQYKPPGSYYAVDQRSELGVYGTASAYCFSSTGERGNELTQLNVTLSQPQNDGQFHVYRFDWNTGTDGAARKIDYYVDGVLQRTITAHVPTQPGRLWLAAWIDSAAGSPNFDSAQMLIDWVKITPNPNAHDVYVQETFPNSGWSLSYPPSGILYDDFTSAQLNPCVWKLAKTQWGGTDVNGGVIPQNVELCDGHLILHANGDLYTGPLRGINKDGSQRADGKRTGAGLVTNQYYASGSYETRLKIAPHYGVSSAIWTFYYVEDYSHPIPQFINHEIDIEMPGRPGSDYTGISFNWALLNTWTGLAPSQYTIGYHDIGLPQDDGQFHTYRIDWHTGDVNQPARVEFSIDGVGQQITTTTIPTRASRFWIGAWFPNQWAGDPNFDTTELVVDWVRITPFYEAGDQYVEESYPYGGWAAVGEYPIGCVP